MGSDTTMHNGKVNKCWVAKCFHLTNIIVHGCSVWAVTVPAVQIILLWSGDLGLIVCHNTGREHYTAQREFGRPTLTPTYLEYKTEAKVN